MNKTNLQFLNKPIPLKEQTWSKGTLPMVATGTKTFNHAPFIRECLEGILMQKTTFPVKVVIFDDCSTDGTREIVKEYEAKFPHLIKGIYPENNTYQKPERKEALKPYLEARATATYIALCEGDDYWTDPLKLQKQIDFLEMNEDYSLCFHNAKVIYEAGKELDIFENKKSHLFKELENREYTGHEILESWTIPAASVVFRTEVLNHEVSSNPNFLYGDIILLLLAAEKGKLYCNNEAMSVYRRHEGGMLVSGIGCINRSKDFIRHNLEVQKGFGGKYYEVEQRILSTLYIRLAKMELKSFRLSFLKSLFIAFKNSPIMFFKNIRNAIQKRFLKL